MDLPTLLLTPMLAATLVLAAAFVARLAHGVAASQGAEILTAEDADRLAIVGQRDRALTTLKDLESEYEMGKLSPQDYDDLRHFYQAEAVRLIERLEALDAANEVPA